MEKLWEKAEPVPYSSVVGQSVLLFHESGQVTCQLALMNCPLDRAGQEWLAGMITDALNDYQPET